MTCSECAYLTKEKQCIRDFNFPTRPKGSCPYGAPKRVTKQGERISGDIETMKLYNTLYRYEEEEYSNRLIHLPCPVGTTIYSVFRRKNFYVKKSKLTFYNMERVLEEFEKTVFLDKSSADAKCEELNKFLAAIDVYYIYEAGTVMVYDHDVLLSTAKATSEDEARTVFESVIKASKYLAEKYSKEDIACALKKYQ